MKLSFANASNLDEAGILSAGKGLIELDFVDKFYDVRN